MMQVEGLITTKHRNPSCVAAAIRVDNLSAMTTEVAGSRVRTTVTGTRLRSVIASVDDYLMNLAVAEETCRYLQDRTGKKGRSTGKARREHTESL